VKKGDWLFDGCELIGKARSDVYMGNAIDVTIFNTEGERVGRVSPPMGGPCSFEPACTASDWTVIEEPEFPLTRFEYLSDVVKPRIVG